MNEPILAYVVGRLDAEKGNWPTIAASSGVPYRTVQKIGSGKVKLPRIDNIEKLAKYFRDTESQAA